MQKYLVGGAVRDRLLSLPVVERDWVVVGARPEELISQGYRQVGKDFPVFLHPETKEEYALARTERKTAQGHQGFSIYSSPDISLEEDLLRRDLTINAIAEDEHGELIDPYHGQKDIQNRILRHVSPAFSEDPLRVLRVARFAARFWDLGFTIAPDTLGLMSSISNSDELEHLSKERIWQETRRALATSRPEIYILILLQINALAKLAPAIASALEDKPALLKLAHLKEIEAFEFRYVALSMIAAESNQQFSLQVIDDINNSFAISNELKELSTLTANHFINCCHALTLPAEIIYLVLLKMDAFRRQERCLHVLKCIESIQKLFIDTPSSSLAFLKDVVVKLGVLSLPEELRQQLAGRELGEAIENLRRETISQELQDWSNKCEQQHA